MEVRNAGPAIGPGVDGGTLLSRPRRWIAGKWEVTSVCGAGRASRGLGEAPSAWARGPLWAAGGSGCILI
eukprot:6194046-Pleurochrysis_carterae.AAC.2